MRRSSIVRIGQINVYKDKPQKSVNYLMIKRQFVEIKGFLLPHIL